MSDSWLCWSKHGDSILRQGRTGQSPKKSGEGASDGREASPSFWTTRLPSRAEAASVSPACHLTTQGALLWHLHRLYLLTP